LEGFWKVDRLHCKAVGRQVEIIRTDYKNLPDIET
jgi:hypothetical protein